MLAFYPFHCSQALGRLGSAGSLHFVRQEAETKASEADGMGGNVYVNALLRLLKRSVNAASLSAALASSSAVSEKEGASCSPNYIFYQFYPQ